MPTTFSRFAPTVLPVLGLFLALASCDPVEFDGQDPLVPGNPSPQSSEFIELGDKIDDPYYVRNMEAALAYLRSIPDLGVDLEGIVIQPTHYYVKFKPKGIDDYEALRYDSIMVMYDYPLDREMLSGGRFYVDPEIPEGGNPYRYATVPVDYLLPDVDYEIVEELYDPFFDSDFSSKLVGKGQDDAAYSLIDSARQLLAGAKDDGGGDGLGGGNPFNGPRSIFCRARWTPRGFVSYFDRYVGTYRFERSHVVSYYTEVVPCFPGPPDFVPHPSLENAPLDARGNPVCTERHPYRTETYLVTGRGSFVPFLGIKVRIKRGLFSRYAITNENGYFRDTGTRCGSVEYSWDWRRHDFYFADDDHPSRDINHIVSGNHFYETSYIKVGTTFIEHPRWDDQDLVLAFSFKAAHKYYYEPFHDLQHRPPPNRWGQHQLRVLFEYLREWPSDGTFGTFHPGNVFLSRQDRPIINIMYGWADRNYGSVYNTMIHELVHAAHWNMCRSCFPHVQKIIKESWAAGVTMIHAHEQGPYVATRWSLYDPERYYTNVIGEMYDYPRPNHINGATLMIDHTPPNPIYTQDLVEGYTLAEMEGTVLGALTAQTWKRRLTAIPNPTSRHLRAVFNYYHL